jgi:bacteriocin-like protein
MEETAMTNDHTRDLRTDASRRELTEDQLDQVSGGQAIVSPRDAASGLPTGKRMHKPFVFA